MDKGFDLNVVTTGDAGKVNHAKPKSRVKDKNVQNVDFLDIVNRLSAKKTEKAQNTPKAQKTQKAQTDSLQQTDELSDTLGEILDEYGAENLNADILMELMSMYTSEGSVTNLLQSDDPMAAVQSSLYSAVLDNTDLLSAGGEMIDEIADGSFDDLTGLLGSSKTLDRLLEVLSGVDDSQSLEQALKTIAGITVTSEINEVDRTVNALSEGLNLSKAVEQAKAEISGNADTAAAADAADAAGETAAQAMGFVDYSSGIAPNEVMTEGTPEENAVFNQTLDVLSRALTEERELYTARLHPEGLGEIIVRMEKSSAGIVFDILTTNERTAAMINQRLMQLQQGMTEYEAKINPAVVTSSNNAESASGFSFDDFTGSMAGSSQQQDAYSGNRNRAGNVYSDSAEDEQEARTTGYRNTDLLNKTI